MANSADFRLATEQDADLETYDFTKLSAINTCPTYGILRYQMHKKMSVEGRSMPLEAGAAMHEAFSFIRLVSLCDQAAAKPQEVQTALWNFHGTRLFGHERLQHIDSVIQDAGDLAEVCKRGSIAVLDTSGFYDDPRDPRRTLSNLEECIYAYINRWRFDHPVWQRDPTDPTSDVGIEIPFDLVVSIRGEAAATTLPHMPTTTGFDARGVAEVAPSAASPRDIVFRLTGRIDGIHYNTHGELNCHDNKTASRLNEAWSQMFLLSHQITGYCAAASVFTGQPIHKAEILGLAIPLPKSYDYGGIMRETVSRRDYHYRQWIDWLVYTIKLAREYKNNPYDAPKFTHSCSRYFRPCIFVPFCDSDDDEKRIIVSEMVDDEWSPLSSPILDGVSPD